MHRPVSERPSPVRLFKKEDLDSFALIWIYRWCSVAVSNDMGQVVNILSQSDIIRFLIPKMDQYSTLFDQTVQECGLATRAPLAVRDTDLTIKALKLMHSQRVSALAVVDAEGRLVGNFSASDLKARCASSWPSALFVSPFSLEFIGCCIDGR